MFVFSYCHDPNIIFLLLNFVLYYGLISRGDNLPGTPKAFFDATIEVDAYSR